MNRSVAGIVLASLIVTAPSWAQKVSVVAVPDSGTADQGTASKPVANVVANDTINGAAAVLGTNAAISAQGVWPAGLQLNTSTGAVTTAKSLPVGQYTDSYQLCDLTTPARCSTTTVTVTVVTAPVLVANPESGTATAGTASKAIQNVAQNDTVNGAAAVLGTGGNATVRQSGSAWPSGIALNQATGAITVGASVAKGAYGVQYSLCDLNVPANCVSTTDSITVNASVANVVANPDVGSGVAGTGSRVVQSVIANDTINGATPVLGTGGNATVAKANTWAVGFVFTTTTGSIQMASTVAPGVYTLPYKLCDLSADCSTSQAVVTVSAAIDPVADTGTARTGATGVVISNVAANDTINGAPAVLGASGNATVAKTGSWMRGLSLNTSSGAVSVTAVLPPGTYSQQYQLCDVLTGPDCANGQITITITPVYTEVQASTVAMGDVEFDWGRDGVYCASCNFGDSNARANWTDRAGDILIAHLNVDTGMFDSPGANDEQVSGAQAFFWNVYGNGPEWAFSTQGGQVVSELVYTRFANGDPNPPNQIAPGYSGAAYATQTGPETWTAAFLPNAINAGTATPGSDNSQVPEASQCNRDPLATVMYRNFETPLQLFTEPVTSPATAQLAPFTSNGIGERFVPCTNQLLFQADTEINGRTAQQVFWYDYDTGAFDQLTTDPTDKSGGFMFQAPDFDDNYIVVTLAAHSTVQVYQQTGTNADGSPVLTLVNSLTSPDPTQSYLNSMEPFIVCTPTCATYVFLTVAKTDSQHGGSVPNGLAVVALSPEKPMFNIMVGASDTPIRQRLDPEYFITPNGAYLYYNQITPQTGSTSYQNNGEFFMDMQLGTPSGRCNGSSAEDGLVPGC